MAACAATCAATCRRPCANSSPTAPRRGAELRARVIKTSGLADPGPVLQTFATDRALGREFHLQALICVIDAVTGMANLEDMPEARRQAALADRIVVTKSDLAEPGTHQRIVQCIGALNPRRSPSRRMARSSRRFARRAVDA